MKKEKPPRRFVRMFKPQFAPLVEAGEKLQTIRPVPARMPEPGDTIDARAWIGRPYHSKQRVLMVGTITEVCQVKISHQGITLGDPGQHGGRLSFEPGPFAVADGFPNWLEMRRWFEADHGLPFTGILIRWKPGSQCAETGRK